MTKLTLNPGCRVGAITHRGVLYEKGDIVEVSDTDAKEMLKRRYKGDGKKLWIKAETVYDDPKDKTKANEAQAEAEVEEPAEEAMDTEDVDA